MNIAIIGLGKLGLPMAAIYADAGHKVLAIDSNINVINACRAGNCPIEETGLNELFQKNKDRMTFQNTYSPVKETDISFIIVPTPSKEDGSFSNEYVHSALKGICTAIKDSGNYHLIVIVSTVMVGSCVESFIPLIEKLTNKKVGNEIGLVYNPEFIALGDVIKGMKFPDSLLIGESDGVAGLTIDKFHKETLSPVPPIHRMSLYNAELAKIALNCYVTMKISYANMIAELCEAIPSGNAYQVLASVGQDSRIGTRYLLPGLSYGGPCFPRDVRSFLNTTNRYNSVSMLASATDAINNRHNGRYVELAKRILGRGKHRVSFLGISYKPNTGFIEHSAATELIKGLTSDKEYQCEIYCYDPMAKYTGMAKQTGSIEECLNGADLCIVATPWDQFRTIKKEKFIHLMRKPNILDCWGIYNNQDYLGVNLYTLGVNNENIR